jgi:hypothetical protein
MASTTFRARNCHCASCGCIYPRTGRFDSVVAKLKIEIIFFDGQRARLKSGLTKVSPMSPGRTLMILVDEMGFEPHNLLIANEENSEIRHGAAT